MTTKSDETAVRLSSQSGQNALGVLGLTFGHCRSEVSSSDETQEALMFNVNVTAQIQ